MTVGAAIFNSPFRTSPQGAIEGAAVRHRVPTDVLLLATVLFWSFNFTAVNFPQSSSRNALLIAVFQRIA